MAIPFPASAGAHILGQPFTLANVMIPVNATITCNCGAPDTTMTILASLPVTCPGCQKTYLVSINPQNGQLQVAMADQAAKGAES